MLRHPRPMAPEGLCYGRLDLVPGAAAPTEIAHALVATPAAGAVFSSPARRALVLAEALAARDGLPLRSDERLLELDFGTWEGRLWSEIDRAESDHWAEDPAHRAPPGGERFVDLLERVADILGEVPPGAVIVSHAGPIRAARMLLERQSFDAVFAAPVPYATPFAMPLPDAGLREKESPWPISR
ncbi:MAG: histidine phosphatase family protein [Pseudomonadota bacterium]